MTEQKKLTFNWDALTEDELESVLSCADPSRISLLDTDYLLEYAAEDTDITWMFYTHVLKPALDKFQAYADYHKEYFMSSVTHHAIQQLGGIWIDTEHLANTKEELLAAQATAYRNILEHPTIRAGIDAYNQAVLANVKADEPKQKYKLIPERTPEPKKITQAGHVSRNWKAWYAREEEIVRLMENPEPTARYAKHLEKVLKYEEALARYDELTEEEIKEYDYFNPKSVDDKRWLLYEALSYPVKVFVFNKNKPDVRDTPAVDESALKGMGEVGELFNNWAAITKELSFIESLSSRLIGDVFHPQFKLPGTYTGRLSGAGGFSMQILPKSSGFLEAFRPRPGHKLVDIDVSGLEDVVLAEMSRDDGKMNLFGPDANPAHDGYMYVGARCGALGKPFLDAGYSLANPTKEGTQQAKKKCKELRNVWKSFVLASNYGAGVRKKYDKLIMEGHNVQYEDVQQMHTTYWEVFQGVKVYERRLLAQLEKNAGWILNGIGRPVGCAQEKQKDILNRMVQSTGHDVLHFLEKIIADDFREHGVPYTPYVWDLHDEVIVEVPDAYADKAFAIMSNAFAKLNTTLQTGNSVVKFKGSGDVMYSLAEAKIEDYKSKWRDKWK